jgi:hypothetical protein
LVNDSEYNQSARQQRIRPHSGIYLVSPGALLLLLRQLRIFAAAAARPHPTPPPIFWGRELPKKNKSPVASGLALGHVCDGAGVVEVVLMRVQSALMGYLSLRESDPRPKGPGPGLSDFVFSYCDYFFWTFLILSASLQAGLC